VGWNEEERARLFPVVPSDRTRGNGHKLKNMKFHLNTVKDFLLLGWSNTGTGCQRSCGYSTLGDNQNPSGHGPGQPALADPA